MQFALNNAAKKLTDEDLKILGKVNKKNSIVVIKR